MATTVLVWVLMVSTTYDSGMVSYSPPVKTQADCEQLYRGLASYLKKPSENMKAQCIQINVVMPGTK